MWVALDYLAATPMTSPLTHACPFHIVVRVLVAVVLAILVVGLPLFLLLLLLLLLPMLASSSPTLPCRIVFIG